ncbi:MAG: hypothetical protein R3B51_14110 [Thermodesulfobacteriota bacterium]
MPVHSRVNLSAMPFVIMILISFVAASCTGGDGSSDGKGNNEVLTIYSGRSEKLIGPIIEQFSEVSGIKTEVKYGSTPRSRRLCLKKAQSPLPTFSSPRTRAASVRSMRFSPPCPEI